MIIRQQCFTLLETLIATALTVIILSTVTYFYQQIDYMNNKSELIQKENFRLLNMENRLSKILPLAIGENSKSNDFYFFTISDPGGIFKQGSSKSLVFTYDNRVDINKSLSNHVLGELFVDTQGRLSLATWPTPNRWPEGGNPPIKREILLEGVDSFTMWFFIPPDKDWALDNDKNKSSSQPKNPSKNPTVETKVKPTPEGGWVNDWSYDYKLLPGMIRLEIKRKGVTENYVFPFSNTSRQVVYNQ